MGKHKYNAIILTTIKGERGPQGFQGPVGQECYTGTGDPNTLGLVLPTYENDPAGYLRGVETYYYQDTVTGDVWTLRAINKVPLTDWVYSTNIKGPQGAQGATAVDKVDVDLSVNGNPALYTIARGKHSESFTIARILFPGTTVAPDFSKIEVISQLGRQTAGNLVVTDNAGNTVAEGPLNGTSVSIQNIPITGTFPTSADYLTFTVTLTNLASTSFLANPYVKMSYINIR